MENQKRYKQYQNRFGIKSNTKQKNKYTNVVKLEG